jgi:hypothetical protein
MKPEELKLATSAPKEIIQILGGITVNFGALENALNVSIWFFLGDGTTIMEERWQILTAQLSFKQLVNMFANLYRHRFPERGDAEMCDLVKRCFKAEDQRNNLIHSLWVDGERNTQEASALRLKLTARSNGFKLQAEEHTLSQLVKVGNEMADLAFDVQAFAIREVTREIEK